MDFDFKESMLKRDLQLALVREISGPRWQVPLLCKQVSVPLLMINIKFGLCSYCIVLADKLGMYFSHIIAILSGLLIFLKNVDIQQHG